MPDVTDDDIMQYFLADLEGGWASNGEEGEGPGKGGTVADQINMHVDDFHMKMLNLSRSWLRLLLPHVLSKISRVQYGLLRPEEMVETVKDGKEVKEVKDNTPRSRRLLAVPFIGKDVPSSASEWSHPDVLIGVL